MAPEPDPTPGDDGAGRGASTVVFPFAFDPLFQLAALPFGVTPGRARVEVGDDGLLAVFGPWSVATPLANIAGATVSGPYFVPKVIGPAHLSARDRGLTFASNARAGVCIEFHEPVTGLVPTDWIRHPGLTVTVADPAALAELLDDAHLHPPSGHDVVTLEDIAQATHDDLESMTASELRERARQRGIDGVASMHKDELIEALSIPDDRDHRDHRDDEPGAPADAAG